MIYYPPNAIISNAKYILTDSRNVLFPDKSIFFAIKGINHDGHQFLKDLYYRGVREFVIEATSATHLFIESISFFQNSTIWVVPNSILALQSFVAQKRLEYHLNLIAITGSNGKTIVKEWLSQLLSTNFTVVKSPKSYNSQLGVPLSVWQINQSHQVGIFEAGISKPNEMENLEGVIQPTIGIFTNIGTAHDEFFKSTKHKIQEKLKLFKQVKKLIYCRDNHELDNEIKEYISTKNSDCELVSWSGKDRSPISFNLISGAARLEFFDGDRTLEYNVPFTDEASIQNLCHCIVAAKVLSLPNDQLIAQLPYLKPVEMRLELKEGVNNTHLIDDSYNNDLEGLKLAIEFLNQQKNHKSKILILSDILHAGELEITLYQNVSKLIEVNSINQLIGIGPNISKHSDLLPANSIFFQDTELFLEAIQTLPLSDATILIKGARPFSFEKIVNALQAKNHDTYLEINLDAVAFNLNYFKQKINPKTRIMAMVKAFAYGAGNKEVASLLQHQGVDYLGVAYTDEGIFLRQNGINIPIMVMNPTVSDFNKMLDYSLEPEIYSLDKLKKFVLFMDGYQGFAKIHIKLDTGMHRLGFQMNDIDKVIPILKQNPNLIISSIFSHLVGSEADNLNDFTNMQANEFKMMADSIAESLGYQPLRHILNSAGISRFEQYQLDMVRLGVGMYGVGSSEIDRNSLQLVGSLKTTISQIKEIEANETVGYGRKGVVTKKSKIATIAIGYADGYNRRFGNGVGNILINGVLCPTIGNICMDMTMVDISNIDSKEGDEVVVFGENPNIYDLANQIGTIPYEILTNIGERVKRVFYKV
ncbi:MAG: bifunctional UDP-N-acetylmuramoyl-tripeptide:D-alanyl-D-alanine ligase/alanine racemase [Bacteroidota bacterium]